MIEGEMDGWRTDGLGPFILETAIDRRMVGQAGLMIFDRRDWTPSTWTLGVWTFNRNTWNGCVGDRGTPKGYSGYTSPGTAVGNDQNLSAASAGVQPWCWSTSARYGTGR